MNGRTGSARYHLVVEDVSGGVPSLRERKKLRTRAMLIDAATELCLTQGYQQTTVEQIAASADVSTRTFSRYFPTKDAVFLTLLDDYLGEVAVELEAVDEGVGPLEAMREPTPRCSRASRTGDVGG